MREQLDWPGWAGAGRAVAVGLIAVVLAGACGSPPPAPSLLATFNANEFTASSADITNAWLPYPLGVKRVFKGTLRNIAITVEVLPLEEVKVIAGIRARAVDDKDYDGAGIMVEETIDYLAQDRFGNVWYMGELTTHYVDGKLTDHADSYYAGIKGVKAGIRMRAEPKLGGPPEQVEYARNLAEDRQRIIGLHQSLCVPLACYTDVLRTEETSPLDPGSIEQKYYARGVGLLRAIWVQGDPGQLDLISMTGPGAASALTPGS